MISQESSDSWKTAKEKNRFPANIYLFKVNNRNISVFLLLIFNIFYAFSSISIVNFQQINVSQVVSFWSLNFVTKFGKYKKLNNPEKN